MWYEYKEKLTIKQRISKIKLFFSKGEDHRSVFEFFEWLMHEKKFERMCDTEEVKTLFVSEGKFAGTESENHQLVLPGKYKLLTFSCGAEWWYHKPHHHLLKEWKGKMNQE